MNENDLRPIYDRLTTADNLNFSTNDTRVDYSLSSGTFWFILAMEYGWKHFSGLNTEL